MTLFGGGAAKKSPLLGILGGMGPMATIDFMSKIIIATEATSDQQHVRMIVVNDPATPDRGQAIASGSADCVMKPLLEGAHRLVGAGAEMIAIPCNTAHHWLQSLREQIPIPIIDMVEVAVAGLKHVCPAPAQVAVLGTRATMGSTLYSGVLIGEGYSVVPLPELVITKIEKVIRYVKARDSRRAQTCFRAVLRSSAIAQADIIVLACTELPLAISESRQVDQMLVDTTDMLAQACVRWAAVASNGSV